MALQSGELDVRTALPYSNLILFRDEPYTISSADTSRTFFGQFNGSSEVPQGRPRARGSHRSDRPGGLCEYADGRKRKRGGRPVPLYFAFGDSKVQEESYDLEYSRELPLQVGMGLGLGGGAQLRGRLCSSAPCGSFSGDSLSMGSATPLFQ